MTLFTKPSKVEYEQRVRQESLILDATELLCGLMVDRSVTKVELAKRLGRSKGFVTQILSGSRNMTLRTLSDVANALGVEVELKIKMKSYPLPALAESPKGTPDE